LLVDFPNRRFYFFFHRAWAAWKEVYYFTGLLIIASIALFLMKRWAAHRCG